jgi:hypothetical protein
MLVGLSVAVTPDEDTDAVRITVPLRPKLCTEIVDVPDEPATSVRLEGLSDVLR